MPEIILEALGINRYGGGRTGILTLLETMFALTTEVNFTVLLSEPEPAWDNFCHVKQQIIRIGNRFAARAYLQAWLPRFVHRERAELVHFTKNLGVFGLGCPHVVTVHDLTTLLLQRQHSPLDVLYWKWIEPLTVRRAARVVAVSRDAACDIEHFYGVPLHAIQVVPWAPHQRFTRPPEAGKVVALRQRYGLPKRYILFVGIVAKKKNLPTLLQSVAILRDRLPEPVDLVVVGRQYPQSDDTLSPLRIRELGIEALVHFTGAVPDNDLPLFYAGAQVYVLPSLHEGFGIPVLEAMSCGTPVIVARAGALPEIAGDAALVLDDPLDASALANLIEQVLRDRAVSLELVRRGYERAATFSWKSSAQTMLDVYRSVLEGKK
jgi:glycosyltransferase involved in cell wall biosynthesis